MSNFDLIAFDMDGTLLKNDKTIDISTLEAIDEVIAAGKSAAICTGRPLAEIKPYINELKPRIRYYILASGAMIYDGFEEKIISHHTIDPKYIPDILEAADKEDVIIHGLTCGKSCFEEKAKEQYASHCMGPYCGLYEQVSDFVDDMHRFVLENADKFEKINLYHVDRQASTRTKERLKHLDIDLVYSEKSSLEVSPKGIDKGDGIRELAEILGISAERIIGVGDADNDIEMLKAAGLGVAMGNANDKCKAVAGYIAKSNEEGGCAEVIRKFMLSEFVKQAV